MRVAAGDDDDDDETTPALHDAQGVSIAHSRRRILTCGVALASMLAAVSLLVAQRSPLPSNPLPPNYSFGVPMAPFRAPNDDAPVHSLADPRYGPEAPVFSEERTWRWLELAMFRSNFARTWWHINVTVDNASQLLATPYPRPPSQRLATFASYPDELHAAMCASLIPATPALKYVEPDWPRAEAKDMARHLRQYRAFLADYYELPKGLPQTATPNALRTLQAVLARALARKRLVLGFVGTSMMAGNDNCYYWTYAETLRRALARVLAPLGVAVEARNLGQDGSTNVDQHAQLLCMPDMLGDDVDVVSLWYHLIDPVPFAESSMFARRLVARGFFFHVLAFSQHDWNSFSMLFSDYMFPVSTAWFVQQPAYDDALHWASMSWGKHGDGRCHLQTREGADGVFMLNWHFGPLGMQMLVDTAMNTYAAALERLVQAGGDGGGDGGGSFSVREFERPWGAVRYDHVSVSGADAPVACAASFHPHFSPKADLNATWFLAPGSVGNPFAPNGGRRWALERAPGQSRPSKAQLAAARVSLGPAAARACWGFGDAGFRYALDASPVSTTTTTSEWFALRMPEHAARRVAAYPRMDVLVCTASRQTGAEALWSPFVAAQYGSNGQPEGPERALTNEPLLFTSCAQVALGVRTLKAGDAMAFTLRANASLAMNASAPFFVRAVIVIGVPA